MKKLMLLSVLILAPNLDGKSVAFSNQAAAAGVSKEKPARDPSSNMAPHLKLSPTPKSIIATKKIASRRRSS